MKLIIRVDPDQTTMTCVKLVNLCGAQVLPVVRDGCGRPALDAYVVVSRAGCKPVPAPWKVWCGCNYVEELQADPEPSGVQYEAWKLDDEGRVCFYWDHLLLEAEPGRYDVNLFTRGAQAASFQIDLRRALRITEVVNLQAQACANC